MVKVGFSRDIHQLIPKKNGFIKLGSVAIKSDYVVKSISDGDVLIHALSEAILGAIGMDDLGTYFPEKKSLGIDSKMILNFALKELINHGYKINNIDALIILDKPHLKNYKKEIKKTLAKLLNIALNQIAIKATSSEGLQKQFIECSVIISIKVVK